jgi:hypothetical protein
MPVDKWQLFFILYGVLNLGILLSICYFLFFDLNTILKLKVCSLKSSKISYFHNQWSLFTHWPTRTFVLHLALYFILFSLNMFNHSADCFSSYFSAHSSQYFFLLSLMFLVFFETELLVTTRNDFIELLLTLT